MPAINVDLQNAKPSTGFDAIPAGKYKVVITESEMKPTKAGSGEYLQLTLEIIEGDYQNRKLWARLNLINPNEKAVEIATAELKAICVAVNVPVPRNTEELHDLPLVVRVSCKPDKDSGEMRNEIKGYEAASKSAQPSQPAAAAGPSKAPWKRS